MSDKFSFEEYKQEELEKFFAEKNVSSDTARNALAALDTRPLRDRFQAVVEKGARSNGWPTTKILLKDLDADKVIFEYERGYSFLNTFEPYRMFDETVGKWRNYALISPKYTGISILDLDAGEIITEEVDGFCPADFYVPDFMEYVESDGDLESLKNNDDDFWLDCMETFLKRRHWGFVAGCEWGDDWSYKLRTIPLTPPENEDFVTYEPFGYFVLPNLKLKEILKIDDFNYFFEIEQFNFHIPTPITFRRDGLFRS